MNGRGRAIFLHPIFIFLHRFNAFHAFLRGRLSPFCTDNGLLPFWKNKTRLGWMEIDHELIVIIDIIARRRGGSVLRCPRMINFKISERWNEFRNGRGGSEGLEHVSACGAFNDHSRASFFEYFQPEELN